MAEYVIDAAVTETTDPTVEEEEVFNAQKAAAEGDDEDGDDDEGDD